MYICVYVYIYIYTLYISAWLFWEAVGRSRSEQSWQSLWSISGTPNDVGNHGVIHGGIRA